MPVTAISADVAIRGLSKRFGDTVAVEQVDLDVRRGEIVALLGPSGCGKTTTLRMIAGLERPSAGEIRVAGRTLVSVAQGINVPPEKRNVGMVFQSYALWPHMTVFDNVAYPLRLRRRARDEIGRRVGAILELMGLSALAGRTVPQLSGGQQQRVALARALVYEPGLMLFDEPFSNLDAQLRSQMRLELKTLRRKVDMTGFFVTHDQVEALSVADRIAIMSRGRIEQIGTPREVYERPRTPFVRDFLGHAVKLRGTLERAGDSPAVRVASALFAVAGPREAELAAGDSVEIAIRPECVEVRADGNASGDNAVSAVIDELLFTGEPYETRLAVGRDSVMLELPSGTAWRHGQAVGLVLPAPKLSLWRAAG